MGVGLKTLGLPTLKRGEEQNVKLEAQFIDTIFGGKFKIGGWSQDLKVPYLKKG